MEEPLAQFLEKVGRACLDYAEELRGPNHALPDYGEEPWETERAISPTFKASVDSLEELRLGPRQRQITDVLRRADSEDITDGMTTSQIGRAIAYDPANVHTALRALESRNIVIAVQGEPIHWKLAARFRPIVIEHYPAVAAQVHAGEWTTYGAVAKAVDSTEERAGIVEQLAVTLEDFPNPHRVVRAFWAIPDTTRELLEAEGITFKEDGNPIVTGVSWYDLRSRWRSKRLPDVEPDTAT